MQDSVPGEAPVAGQASTSVHSEEPREGDPEDDFIPENDEFEEERFCEYPLISE